MEVQLVYLYINKFKGIQGQGFNLNSNYHVTFNATNIDQNVLSPRLFIKTTQSGLPHLFHPQIKDIRGIIGENGAGKSTLIEYLTHAGHDQTYLQDIDGKCRDILIYQTSDSKGTELHVVLGSGWNDELIRRTSSVPENTRFIQMHQFSYEDLVDFRTTAFIYYSNVFDNKSRSVYGELRSISTNFLVKKDQEKLTNTKVSVDVLDAHRVMESRRQVEFVLQFREETDLPLDIPEQIYVWYNTFARLSLKKKLENETNQNPDSMLSSLLSEWMEHADDQKFQIKLSHKAILKREYFCYFIDNLILGDDQIMHESFPGLQDFKLNLLAQLVNTWKESSGELDLDALIRFAETGENIVEQNPGNKKISFGDQQISLGLGDTSLKRYLLSFKDFSDFLFSSEVEIKNTGPAGFVLQLNNNSKELYRRYYNSLFITTYLDFSFPELSSGELAFLTLFSRFYSLVNTTNSLTMNHDGKQNLIIFIDEGDLYFHPSWQAKFLGFVNDMLPRIFPLFSIQLIVSSHSPFIASDLTPDHLLFLKRINRSAGDRADLKVPAGAVVTGPERTFAANIHELLSHSYFMKGVHIGELAKNTLYRILDQLEGKPIGKQYSNEELLALIDQIGEPWMRSRLKEKFDNYRNIHQHL